MKMYVVLFIIALCISCATGGLPPSPVYMSAGVRDVIVSDSGEVPTQRAEAYTGDVRIVDIDRDMVGASRYTDSSTGARTDFPQYGRF